VTAGYSGTPLPRKLGIKDGSTVLAIDAPVGLELGAAYDVEPGPGRYHVVLLFCRDAAALYEGFEQAAAGHTTDGMIWVCWPKKASGVPTDLNENVVREYGLAHGRVDVKVAAIDATWSGLKFVIRLADR
jgi:hypothetical protein